MKDTTVDMTYLLEVKPNAEDLATDHALDISASVYHRLKELNMTQSELAKRLGVDKSWVSRIIHGYPGMSLKTIAKLELALDIDLSSGFVYRPNEVAGDSVHNGCGGAELAKSHKTTPEPQVCSLHSNEDRYALALAVE